MGDFNIPQYSVLRDDPLPSNRFMVSLNNFSDFFNMKQYNETKNFWNRTLDIHLVFSRSKLFVNKYINPLLHEDRYHPALDVDVKLDLSRVDT